ncbi:MAG TPA: PKD domain-containing protein [Gaiellaceae bacterium]|nr:PKD domain-containing protein [Gaiellaceae bacterium]
MLAFNGSNFSTDQNVFVYAVDDGRAEGTRVVTASHSVIQPVCNGADLKNCFDGAVASNVEVTVYDNDTADVLVTALDPNTLHPDNNSVVLEGWGQATALHPATEQIDKYAISLASAPASGKVVVDLNLSDLAPDPTRVCLTSADARFDGSAYPDLVPGDPSTCPSAFDPTKPYKVTFTTADWFMPIIVTLHGRNDFAPEDPHNTTITHTVDPAQTTDPKYLAVIPGGSFAGTATLANNVAGDTISTTSFDWAAAGFAVGQAISVGGVGKDSGVYHIAAIVGTTNLRLVEKGVLTTLLPTTVFVSTANSVNARLDVMVLDDENPGVWVLESDGKTVVTACGLNCGVPGSNDTYQLRLTSQPTSQVKIGIITDGQVDVQNDGGAPLDSRLKLEQVGGLQASQAFKGPITMSAAASGMSVITRANGSDLGNFIAEGFQKNMRVRLAGLGAPTDGDYVIVDISADGSMLTVAAAPPLPGGTPGTLPGSLLTSSGAVFISILEDKGVYQGDVAYDPNGVGQALYTGGLSSTGTTTLTRVTGSFISDQFMVGTRIQIADQNGTVVTGGPYTITDVSDKTMTFGSALPVFNYNTATISKITGTLIRTDGTSWLDSGFLEGQLIRVTLPDGTTDLGCSDNTTYNDAAPVTCLYKIEMITGTDPQKTNKISLTSTSSTGPFAGSPYRPDELTVSGDQQLAVVQWAWDAYFSPPNPGNAPQTCPVATCGNWYQPITVPLIADPFFELAPGRENLTTFPKQPHLLSGIRGPLSVEGGTTAADRSLKGAVLLPGEDNLPPFRVAAQPPEWQSIDTLNVYGDGSKEDTKGNLTSTALTGLNMGAGLDFTSLCGGQCPFNEPGKYPGGISYGSISLDPITHNFTTDGTLSTLEIVNIMLGAGNDTLNIQSTLQPGGDFNPITGLRGEIAHHGGITAVHGGGNALLRVDGTFELTALSLDPTTGTMAKLVRQDGLSWQRYGFLVGQQLTLSNGASYTITGFGTGPYGSGDTMYLGGGPTPTPPSVTGTVNFTQDAGGDLISGLSFAGFAVNQAITVTGAGVDNGVYHIVQIVNPTTIRLAETLAVTTAVGVTGVTILGDTSGQLAVSDALSVTSTFTLYPNYNGVSGVNGVLLTNGQSWISLGFAVGQQVFIPGQGVRTIVGYDNGPSNLTNSDGLPLDGAVLLVGGSALPAVQLTGTISLASRYRINASLTRIGAGDGGNVVLTGPSFTGTATLTPTTITRGGGSWITDGFALGQQISVSGAASGTFTIINLTALTLTVAPVGISSLPSATGSVTVKTNLVASSGLDVGQQVWVSGVNGTRTISAINGDTLTLTGGLIASGGPVAGTVSLMRIGGDNITLTGPTFAGTLTAATATTLSRSISATSDWIKDGFAVGQQVILGGAGGLTGVFNVTNVTKGTLTLGGGTLTPGSYANSTITVLPIGAGPGQPYDNYAPLVIYGDTSQDGVWYGGDPHNQSLHNFGPKPMPHVDGLPITITRDNINGFTGAISMTPGPSVVGTFSIRPVGYTNGTHIFNLTPTTITRTDAGSFVADGFAIGQMIGVTGDANATFQVAGVSAATLTLTPIAGSLPNGTLAASLTIQSLSAFKITQAGTWSATDFAAGATIDVTGVAGGTFTVVSGGGTATLLVAPVGLSTLPVNASAALTVTKLNTGTNSSGSFLTDGFAVGQEMALGPPTSAASSCPGGHSATCVTGLTYDIWENHLTLHGNLDNSWSDLGFVVGQQITIDPYSPSTWTVEGFSGAGNSELELNGPQLDPLPNVNFKVTSVSQYIGIVKTVTKTSITLNLALSIADFPSGPLFPVAKGGSTTTTANPLKVLNRIGNSAPFFVFPLANPYLYSGNDVIDAHLLDWTDETSFGPSALRPIGLTIYGGPGSDTIIGSQTGDQLAGGSGNDTILGQRGEDIIYGDSGFNVDLITRQLNVATVGTGPAGYNPAKFVDLDHLVAGNDLLYGEGPGSAPSKAINTLGNDDDIIFGDLGVVTQDVSGPRDVTKAVPTKPQAIQTTIFSDQTSILHDRFGATPSNATPQLVTTGVKAIDSAPNALQNAGNDWIYGNTDRDILIGNAGNDAIDGGVENDLIFGDNVSLHRTYHDTTSARFQALCGSLLYSRSDEPNPCGGTVNADNSGQLLVDGTPQAFRDPTDVPWWSEYDVMNMWQDFNADPTIQSPTIHWAGSFGDDYIAGNAGSDLAFGELGNDTIQGDGSIDFVAHQMFDDSTATTSATHFSKIFPGSYDPLNVLGRVTSYRSGAGCIGTAGTNLICVPTGAETIYPSIGRTSDGEDYIEGNGGYDIILGGLGQDDLVGGNSDFFSLVTPDQRPDVNDLIFGGSGELTARNEDTGNATAANISTSAGARDADTIVSDNGDIVRIVGVNHVDTTADNCTAIDARYGPGNCLNNPSVAETLGTNARYLTFVYDDADTSVGGNHPDTKLIVHGVTLLDYTPGGPDFRPDLFNTNTGNCQSGSPASGPCSNPLTTGTCHGTGPGTSKYNDIGGGDEVHGESGNDTIYTGCGNDVIFGDAGNDTIVAGWGDDWVSSGTGYDGVLGDDGRLYASRNSTTGYTWNNALDSYTQSPNCANTTTWTVGNVSCLSEPLYGVKAFLVTDPDTKTSQGNVINEYAYTPGQVQTVTINVVHYLVVTADETPFDLSPPPNADNPLYDANNSDDVIFGGWDGDFLHGGAGDDAISGAEALKVSYVQDYYSNCTPAQQLNNCVAGLDETDWYHPWNPGDILHFGADTNPWLSNHHIQARLGEFLLYNEYDPRRAIEFNTDGTVWSCNAFSNSGHQCTGSQPLVVGPDGVTPKYQFFLNNDAKDGRLTNACIAVDNQGNCTLHSMDPGSTVNVYSDGNDEIFGDLGNDWLVGGTSQNEPTPAGWNPAITFILRGDTLWGGWGNDLLNVDDDLSTGCAVPGNGNSCATVGSTYTGDVPDGPNNAYEDRAFGGAGLDILIGNTGGDRLIDWVGEFNSYIVPFAPFGIATVSRQVEPQLPEFLYALSFSQGSDPTRASDTGSDPVRNGEPNGEIGLVTQHDHGIWQQQTGSPSDPQAGNLPGGRRDVLRSADFNDGTSALVADSGVWTVAGGTLQVAAASKGKDADAVLYLDQELPTYYELLASVKVQKPTAGWNGNAFMIFDYFGPTDFKFAGIDIAINKVVLGHRDASGWHYDYQGALQGGLAPNTSYDMQVVVNGLVISVLVNGVQVLSQQLSPRWINGVANGFNMGLVGVGSNNSQGVFDNVIVQALPPLSQFANTDSFDTGTADYFTGDKTGTWTVSSGTYNGTATSSAAAAVLVPGVPPTPDAYVEWETVLKGGGGLGGLAFDYYSSDDYKYVTLDTTTGALTIGHLRKGRFVTDFTMTATITPGADQKLTLALSGTSVTVSVNGVQQTVYYFNSDVVDGSLGLLTKTGSKSFDNTRIQVGTHIVNAVDSVPPTLTVPADVTRNTDAGKPTAFLSDSAIGTASGSDNIGLWPIVRSGVPAGNLFPIGVTTVSWTATDYFGNTVVKTQKITVLDAEKPVLTTPSSQTLTIPSSQSSVVITDAQLGTATATDNSGAVTLVRSGVPAGNSFQLGTTTITYTATDASGNVTTATQTITVRHAGVTFTPGPSQSANEGASTTFNLGSFANGTGPYTVLVTWGDGTSSSFSASPGSLSAAHAYVNGPATFAVTVKVTDSSGAFASGSFSVTVANLPPTVSVTSPAAGSSFQAFTPVTARASFSDPGTGDTHTCTVMWGDGTSSSGVVSETSGTGTCTGTHTYTAAGSYTITLRVTDSGGASTSASVGVTITPPPPPVLTGAGNQTASEGSVNTFSLGSVSGGVGPYTVLVTWGNGTSSSFVASAGALSLAHTYANDGSKTVTVKVTDSAGASTTGSFTVAVANVAPSVTITFPSGGSIFKLGSSVSVGASFSDAGTSDTHTCTIAWGDGTTSTGTVSESGGAGTCSGNHVYANVGNYTVTVTVTDNGAAAGSASVGISVTKTGKAAAQTGGTLTNGPLRVLQAKVPTLRTKKVAHATIARKTKQKTKHRVTTRHGPAARAAKVRRVLLGGSVAAHISANWGTPGVVYVSVLSNHSFHGTVENRCVPTGTGTTTDETQSLGTWVFNDVAHEFEIDTSFNISAAGSGANCTITVMDGRKLLAQQSFVSV